MLKKAASPKPLSPSQNWEQAYHQLKDKHQYVLAEYANYIKQNTKQINELKKYDGQIFIKKLLASVMDDFDKAMECDITEKNLQTFKEGIQMIYKHLKQTLNAAGVRELECQNKPFDPALHTAIGATPSDTVPPDHIINVLKKAYYLHDKLIRPAMVIVAEKPGKE